MKAPTIFTMFLVFTLFLVSLAGTSPTGSGKVKLAGVNISGFDFGMKTTGLQNLSSILPPLPAFLSELESPDGIAQMKHFATDDNLNMFRLPMTWQYLVNNKLGNPLHDANFEQYDQLVQACLETGAHCIVDLHNYARWNGNIIGQGGPTTSQFVSLWAELAEKYKGSSNIIFGIMNEPHDLNMGTWSQTLQAVVRAIRNAGATSQTILLPGTGFSSTSGFVSLSSMYLKNVTNPDNSTTNLVFDVHQYLDEDYSGTHAECVRNDIDNAWQPFANWLRDNKRQAIVSETGGGNTDSCQKYLCEAITFFNNNADVYLGFTTWGAGAFGPSYALVESPFQITGGAGILGTPLLGNNGGLLGTGLLSGITLGDRALVKACVAR